MTSMGEPGLRLADQLKLAWTAAGRPSMGDIGDAVGYSKDSIVRVLSGETAPAWHLVRKLGVALRVPTEVVEGAWHALWVAADQERRAAAPPNLPEAHRWASLRDAVGGRDARNASPRRDLANRMRNAAVR